MLTEGKQTKKRAAAGEFTPSQFAACLANGLNIRVHDRLSTDATANATSAAVKPKGGSLATATDEAKNPTTCPPLPCAECTNGAMEALRLCHATFLATLSSSLGELQSMSLEQGDPSSAKPPKPLTETDVLLCMERMGLAHVAERAMTSLSSGAVKRAPRKKRKKNHFAGFEGTQEELMAQQEALLAESAQRVQAMHRPQLSGKSEECRLP